VSADRARLWLLALLPLALLAVLMAAIVAWEPTREVRGDQPPVERLAFPRVTLGPQGIELVALNDGPDPVTIAQVQVDDAYWTFTVDGGPPPRTLERLARARLAVPYPWVTGEAHVVRVVTATGATFDHEIPVAVETPQPGARFLGIFALIGTYVGILPVALGLLWYPLVRRLGPRTMDFLLALTIGLLLFLLVDSAHEGLEAAAEVPGSFQGIALFAFGVAAAYLSIEAFGEWLGARRAGLGVAERGWVQALLVAVGIGLHNFGEGLAIGAALALGEAALGTLLILGFTLHNTTEGLAIVAPIARSRVPLSRLVLLGLIGGVPTIPGAWLGGFLYSPLWSVLFLAIGAGAIAQVVVQIAGALAGDRPLAAFLRSGPVLGGLAAGFALMYTTGMLVQ
jgi:zinc transporter ZupT